MQNLWKQLQELKKKLLLKKKVFYYKTIILKINLLFKFLKRKYFKLFYEYHKLKKFLVLNKIYIIIFKNKILILKFINNFINFYFKLKIIFKIFYNYLNILILIMKA